VHTKSRVREWTAFLLLVSYLVVIVLVTLSPTPIDQGYRSGINKVLDVLHRNGIPEWFGYGKLEFSANIAMFIPLGFLIALALPARLWWVALLVVPSLSAAIEIAQGAFLAARFSSAADVAANSIGGFIGIMIAFALRALVYSRDQKVISEALRARGVST